MRAARRRGRGATGNPLFPQLDGSARRARASCDGGRGRLAVTGSAGWRTAVNPCAPSNPRQSRSGGGSAASRAMQTVGSAKGASEETR